MAWVLLAVGAGLCYDAWVRITGRGVPCLFYQVTGLLCPGCGMTRLCMALLRLDFAAAFKANAAILCLFPVWGAVFGVQAVRYVRSGEKRFKNWQNVLTIISIILLLLFGILRNLPVFALLAD